MFSESSYLQLKVWYKAIHTVFLDLIIMHAIVSYHVIATWQQKNWYQYLS